MHTKTSFALVAFWILILSASNAVAWQEGDERQVSFPRQALRGVGYSIGGAGAGVLVVFGAALKGNEEAFSAGASLATIISGYFLGMGYGLATPLIENKDPISYPGMVTGILVGYGFVFAIVNGPPVQNVHNRFGLAPLILLGAAIPPLCGALGSRLPWAQSLPEPLSNVAIGPYMPRPDAQGILLVKSF
jgi:hypothetical protein